MAVRTGTWSDFHISGVIVSHCVLSRGCNGVASETNTRKVLLWLWQYTYRYLGRLLL